MYINSLKHIPYCILIIGFPVSLPIRIWNYPIHICVPNQCSWYTVLLDNKINERHHLFLFVTGSTNVQFTFLHTPVILASCISSSLYFFISYCQAKRQHVVDTSNMLNMKLNGIFIMILLYNSRVFLHFTKMFPFQNSKFQYAVLWSQFHVLPLLFFYSH